MINLTDEQVVALTMFKDDVPCIMAFIGECGAKAAWLLEIAHLGEDCGAITPNPLPLCPDHKDGLIMALNPFWAMFNGAPSVKCEEDGGGCGGELRAGEAKRIGDV